MSPWASVQAVVEGCGADELPVILGRLAELQARAMRRLTVSAPAPVRAVDENVSVEEGARRLGVSDRWIYKHADRLPFVRRIGRRVLCSSRALAEWNDRRRG